MQEFLPEIGGEKSLDEDMGKALLSHAADLHAYSSVRIEELKDLFPGAWQSLPNVVAEVTRAVEDSSFLTFIGISEQERKQILECCKALERRPTWVEEWERVCVTLDIAPDNVGIRRSDGQEQLVTFDWSAATLAPMEAELDVIMMRLQFDAPELKEKLIRYYLEAYAARTGRLLSQEVFQLRLPWIKFALHLERIAGCLETLRWVPHVIGPRNYIHLCVEICTELLDQLAFE